MWAAGFTEGGLPYGMSEDEFRAASARYGQQAPWARAKRFLEAVVAESAGAGATVDVGYVKKMGHGLSRDAFAAEVEITSHSTREVAEIAVLLPRRGCDPAIDERTRKEARLLHDLAGVGFPFDWEYAQLGDPAYDLAIVTRGVRRPFQIDGGMDRLLDSYNRVGGVEVSRAHVHLHELALAARWYRDALDGESAPAQQLQLLRSVLRQASGAAS